MTLSAMVAIVGLPNSGKSTLLNAILGEDLAPVHHREQMTRKNLLGIYTKDDLQIVFHDTPGLHELDKPLNQQLKGQWESAIKDSDFLLVLMDPTQKFSQAFFDRMALLSANKTRLGLLNKCDQISKWEWQPDQIPQNMFKWVYEISALNKSGLQKVLDGCRENALPQPFFYDSELYTTATLREIASQKIMEVLMSELGQEIPYECAVHVETYKESERLDEIHCVIVVNKDSQKGMVIGSKGQKIKTIGIKSRQKLETFLGKKVRLETFVKVDKDWIKNSTKIKTYIGIEE